MTDDDESWSAYYDRGEGRETRELLLAALGRFERPGDAVDLGCGSGIETLTMLERGWSVFATDQEEEAIRRVHERVPAELSERLRTLVSPMEDVEIPPADLVWASFSLFFCRQDAFPDLWWRIRSATHRGGRFAGQLLGDRDTWARDAEDPLLSFRTDDARALFDGFEVERFDEEEKEDEPGPKWWHLYHVIARRT